MDSIIKAEVQLSYEDLKAFDLYHEVRKGKNVRPSFLLLCAVTILMLGTIAMQLVSKFDYYYLVFFIIILALPFGRYAVLVNRTKKAHQEYEQKGSKSVYDFTQDTVYRDKSDSSSGSVKAEFKYDSYVRAVETKKAFYLYITENEVNIIPKSAITLGTAEELTRLLNGKMGDSFVIGY